MSPTSVLALSWTRSTGFRVRKILRRWEDSSWTYLIFRQIFLWFCLRLFQNGDLKLSEKHFVTNMATGAISKEVACSERARSLPTNGNRRKFWKYQVFQYAKSLKPSQIVVIWVYFSSDTEMRKVICDRSAKNHYKIWKSHWTEKCQKVTILQVVGKITNSSRVT